MPYLAEFVAVLVPILLNFLNKHGDEYLGKIFAKLGSFISAKTGSQSAALIVSTAPYASVEFDRGDGKIIKKVADSSGYAEFTEKLNQSEKITIRAYADGYTPDETILEIDNEFVTYHVLIRLKKKKRG